MPAYVTAKTISFPTTDNRLPNIFIQPQNVRAKLAQDSCFFTVTADHGEDLKYAWKRNGTLLVDDATYKGVNDPVLEVVFPGTAGAATFSCVISNNIGSVTSTGATLTIV